MNHHFTRNNSVYSEIEHPRWGIIQSVRLYQKEAEKLDAGDELFTYYGYKPNMPFPSDFPWYWELKVQSDLQIRKQKQVEEKRAETKAQEKKIKKKKGSKKLKKKQK